jgi:hypothetical protein
VVLRLPTVIRTPPLLLRAVREEPHRPLAQVVPAAPPPPEPTTIARFWLWFSVNVGV